MEELWQLKEFLLHGNVQQAILLVDEMTEMSKEDKLNKIFSFGIVLLLHLIKQRVEHRTTRSWDISIFNAVKQIQRVNQRRSSGGYYFTPIEIQETLADGYESALKQAALEVCEGQYEVSELAAMVDRHEVIAQAMNWLASD